MSDAAMDMQRNDLMVCSTRLEEEKSTSIILKPSNIGRKDNPEVRIWSFLQIDDNSVMTSPIVPSTSSSCPFRPTLLPSQLQGCLDHNRLRAFQSSQLHLIFWHHCHLSSSVFVEPICSIISPTWISSVCIFRKANPTRIDQKRAWRQDRLIHHPHQRLRANMSPILSRPAVMHFVQQFRVSMDMMLNEYNM